MNVEQKSTIRGNAQSILDLARARLADDRLVDQNVIHDLGQIVICAKNLLNMVGPPASPWSAEQARADRPCRYCGLVRASHGTETGRCQTGDEGTSFWPVP